MALKDAEEAVQLNDQDEKVRPNLRAEGNNVYKLILLSFFSDQIEYFLGVC